MTDHTTTGSSLTVAIPLFAEFTALDAIGPYEVLQRIPSVDVVFVGHGLTQDTRSLLIDGTMDAVITQNQLGTMMSCAAIFNNLRAGRGAMHGIEPPRSEIIFRENIPGLGG